MEAPLAEVRVSLRRLPGLVALAALLLAATLPTPVAASAWESWRTLETEHFDVHFPDGGYELALRSAGYLEAAHQKLVPLLGHRPRLRIQVVLTDDVDYANGSARVSPYPLVRGYMAPPTADGFLSTYDDFLWILLVHELVHILHLDKASGLPELGNRIFGRQFTPNHLAPRWLVEGLAIWQESSLSAGGRNDSALVDMVIRTQIIEDGRVWPIDRVSGAPISWPGGNAWYLFGGRFIEHLVSIRGEVAGAAFTEAYGSRVVPYLLNTTAKRSIDITLTAAWEDWSRTETERQLVAIERIRAEGLVEGERISELGRVVRSPRWTPDGALIALATPGDAPTALRRFDLSGLGDAASQGVELRRAIGTHGFDLSSDGHLVILSTQEPHRFEQWYDDLFLARAEGGSPTRLSHGLRARDPALSPDGRMVAFVSRRRGQTALYMARLDPGEPGPKGVRGARMGTPVRVFHEPEVHVDRPSFSPDGSSMVFSASRRDAGRDIVLLDLTGIDPSPAGGETVQGAVRGGPSAPKRPELVSLDSENAPSVRLTDDGAQDLHPVFDPSGRMILFSSDRGGVFDLYALPVPSNDAQDPRPQRLTRTLTGAFEPRVSPDGSRLAYVTYHAAGYDLAWLPLSFHALGPGPKPPRAAPSMSPDPVRIFPVRGYNPLKTLRPYHWAPYASGDLSGQTLGATTGGTDAVGDHSWSTSLWLGLGTHRPGYNAWYSYRGLVPSLSVASSRTEYRTSAFHVREGRPRVYDERSLRLTTSADLFVPSNIRRQSLSLTLTVDHRKVLGGILPFDPGEPVPMIPEDGLVTRVRLSWSASSVRSFVESHVPFEGNRLRLATEVASPRLGGDFGWVLATAGATFHLRLPFPRNHVFAGNLDLGVAAGSFGGRNLFTLGGLPVDDLLTMIRNPGGRSSTPMLRGFAPNSITGDAFASANLEHRFPLFSPERGYRSLPVFLRRIHGATFADSALVASSISNLGSAPLRAGIGAEARAELMLGYYQTIHARLGFAHGFGEGAVSAPYFGLGGAF